MSVFIAIYDDLYYITAKYSYVCLHRYLSVTYSCFLVFVGNHSVIQRAFGSLCYNGFDQSLKPPFLATYKPRLRIGFYIVSCQLLLKYNISLFLVSKHRSVGLSEMLANIILYEIFPPAYTATTTRRQECAKISSYNGTNAYGVWIKEK